MTNTETEKLSKSERTKTTIIEAAAHLFNTKGFAGTSMKDIMKATGLSKGGLYGNFETKEEIAVAAFDHAVKKVWAEARERTKHLASPLDKLEEVVAFYRERVLNPPVEGGCPIQNTAVDADDTIPALKTKAKEALQLWQERIIWTLKKGIEHGLVRPDIDTKAFAIRFIGSIEGGILLARLCHDIHYFDRMAEQLYQLIEEARS